MWPGPSAFPDFTRQSTREWWGSFTTFISDGVAGFWNDMNEPSVFSTPDKTIPGDVLHRIDEPGIKRRTASHFEIHDVYGMENSRATYEGLLKILRTNGRSCSPAQHMPGASAMRRHGPATTVRPGTICG